MTVRALVPGDRVLAAAFWAFASALRLDATQRTPLLFLWSLADRDGVAPVDPAQLYEAIGADPAGWPRPDELRTHCWWRLERLQERGALVLWQTGDGDQARQWWVWIPEVASWQPTKGTYRVEVRPDWPAPPSAGVAALLRARGQAYDEAAVAAACPRAVGRSRAASGAPADDVRDVFEEWRRHQGHPDACALTPSYQRLIRGALKHFSSDVLVRFLRYAFTADDAGPRFWRGENRNSRTYLGLDNLLVQEKLPARIQATLDYEARAASEDGDSFGAFGPSDDGEDDADG